MPTNLSNYTLFTFSDSKSVLLRVTSDSPLSSHSGFIDLKHYSSPYGIPAINASIIKDETTFSNFDSLTYSDKENILLQSLISAHAYKDFSHIHSTYTEEYLIPFAYEKVVGKKFIIINDKTVPIIEFKLFSDLLDTDPAEYGIFSQIANLAHTLDFQKRFGHMLINPKINITEQLLIGESAINKRFLDPKNTWFLEENKLNAFKFTKELYPFPPHSSSSVINKISEFMPTLSYIHAHPEFKLENLGGSLLENNNKTYDATILQHKSGFNISCVIDNYSPAHWTSKIHSVYNGKCKNLGLQHPDGKVLVNTSYANPEFYKNIPKYDLVTIEDNNKFVKTFFNVKEKECGIAISLEKVHTEYKISNLEFQNSTEILVPYGSFKSFIENN